MRLTRKNLRRIILSEIRVLQETRQDHIRGIKRKIEALENELSRQRYHITLSSSSPGPAATGVGSSSVYQEMAIIEDKIDMLKRELDHLVDHGSPAAY